jgi:hypothetical protein
MWICWPLWDHRADKDSSPSRENCSGSQSTVQLGNSYCLSLSYFTHYVHVMKYMPEFCPENLICVHYHIEIENEIVHVQMSRIDSCVRVILLPAQAAFT